MQSFVDDLLDLRQIKEGVFSLTDDVFDPADVLDTICEIFAPQTSVLNVRLFWMVEKDLAAPGDYLHHGRDLDRALRNIEIAPEQDSSLPKLVGDVRRFQ